MTFVILAKNKHNLRYAIKKTHEILNELQLSLHPNKTYIGRVSKGFNFLGYYFDDKVLLPSKETLRRSFEKASSLYEDFILEQDRSKPQIPKRSKYRRPKRDTSIYQADESPPGIEFLNHIFTSVAQMACHSEELEIKMNRYIRKWLHWVKTGLGECYDVFMTSLQAQYPLLFELLENPKCDVFDHIWTSLSINLNII